jgi:hypothetical protein
VALQVAVAVDCADPHALAEFWAGALGYAIENHSAHARTLVELGKVPSEYVIEAGERLAWRDYAGIRHPDDPHDVRTGAGLGRRIVFQRVPEPKSGKNRLHLDLHVGRERRQGEVERLAGLGASVLREVDDPLGRWTVMADPEGNEFCVA